MNDLRIKQIIRESINSLLLEDKTVTFNGQVNPKYGWVVFIVGAPGSGKSTVSKNHIPIQGKIISADYFRDVYADLLNMRDRSLKYNFRNLGPMKSIKKKTEPNKQDKRGRWTGGHGFLQQLVNNISQANTNKSVLPNLIVDMLGVNPGPTNWMFDVIKKMGGYKVSFIWVLTNKDVAFVNNTQRDMVVPTEYLLRKHNQALGFNLTAKGISIQSVLEQHSDDIDEAWIIVNSSFDDIDGERIYRRPNEIESRSNVVKLQKLNGVFRIPDMFGIDERKPFMGGRKNVSMKDITGNEVQFNGHNPLNYPEIYQKGDDGKTLPTDITLAQIAKNNKNNRILNNVDISHDQEGIKSRTNKKINKLKNGQRGVSHLSLM